MSVLGARHYDPSVGRFLSADPIGIAGGINQFNYCGGDPVNRLDPSGLDWFSEPFSEDEEAILKIAVGVGTTAGGVIGGFGGGTGGFILGGVGGAGIGAIPGTAAGVVAGGAAGAFVGGVAGGTIGIVGIYGARGIRALAGSLATFAATKGGGSSCPPGGGGGGRSPQQMRNDEISTEQRNLVKEFLGSGTGGVAERSKNFYVPKGLSRETLLKYRGIAEAKKADHPDHLGTRIL